MAKHEILDISDPGPHDVICGRGAKANNHDGNVLFRTLVKKHKLRYIAASKIDKPRIAREVVKIWRSQSPPGRFLMKASIDDGGGNDNSWYDVGDSKAREKASQCLRERTPEVIPFVQKLRGRFPVCKPGKENADDVSNEAVTTEAGSIPVNFSSLALDSNPYGTANVPNMAQFESNLNLLQQFQYLQLQQQQQQMALAMRNSTVAPGLLHQQPNLPLRHPFFDSINSNPLINQHSAGGILSQGFNLDSASQSQMKLNQSLNVIQQLGLQNNASSSMYIQSLVGSDLNSTQVGMAANSAQSQAVTEDPYHEIYAAALKAHKSSSNPRFNEAKAQKKSKGSSPRPKGNRAA